MTILGPTSAGKPPRCLRRLEGDAKSQLRSAVIAVAILQHFDVGFRMAAVRKFQETCRTAPKMMRFWQNSTRSHHSGGIRDSQRVSSTCSGEPLLTTPGATGVLATWAPDLHAYYADTLDALHTHNPSLKRIFPTSIFAATTYNFGPRTVCFKHTDFANLPFGMCAVTAFGDFDPKKGGHLILWECGLVIEFPPGSTILLPSATISHSNVTIGRNERRYSFTQYTAGGLFRWVENGFQKSTEFRASLSPEESAKQDEKDAQRWAWGLSLLPRFILPGSF